MDTEEFAPLKELIEITNSDIHTFDMVYTENTGSIKRFADGDMVIIDGRGLEPEDSESKNTVCVVSHAFANANGLEVGDTLNFNLGTELFEQYKSLGALAVTHERYKAADTPVSLEIVGIYSNTDGATNEVLQPNWSYSDATVFLPSSFLPAEVPAEHMYSPAEFSFTVRSWDITPFLEETAPKIEAMGLFLTFNDGGWIDIETAFKETDKLAVVRIGILAAAMVIADGFAVYLFISRRKKDYGIMRALGTTKRASSKAISVPFICLSVLSIAAGTIIGFIYTKHTLYQNHAINLLENPSASAVIPGWTVAACALGELILILIVTGIMIHNMGKQPPLLLLQGKGGKRAKRKSGVNTEDKTAGISIPPDVPKFDLSSVITPELDRSTLNGSGAGFILRYILRHMRRAGWKTVLSILIAGIMLAAIGQFKVVHRSYESLCENTVVTARFVGGLPVSSGRGLMNSGYAKNLYYGVSIPSETNGLQIDVALTNNINRYTNEKADIDFAPGYDDSCISEPGNTVIIGNELMEMYSLKPGDSVHLISEAMKESLWTQAYFEYSKKHLYSPTEPDQTEINSIYQELFTQSLEEYTIAGVVTTPSGNYSDTIFMPGSKDIDSAFGPSLPADLIEITLSDYMRLDELKSFGERIVKASPEISFVLDTEKLEAPLNTLNILTKLYPTAVAAALVIGAFLCCLILLQSSKEASIMRVLGTTKGKTRAIMLWEQIFLCIIGLILGLAGLVIYNRGNILTVMGQLGIFAAAYLAVIVLVSLVTSTLIMRKDLLTLLQTKE